MGGLCAGEGPPKPSCDLCPGAVWTSLGQNGTGEMKQASAIILTAWVICLAALSATAGSLLDGRAYRGMIGPADNPDLADSLYFDSGHFWSDICTRCGFVPGRYEARNTEDGVSFSGVLESEGRGTFTYEGMARSDGTLSVAIRWERRRWYWTFRRDIVFQGTLAEPETAARLETVRQQFHSIDPGANPLCARF